MPTHGLAGLGRTPEESEILEPLVDTLDRFGKAELDARRIDREHRIPREILAQLADMGMFGLSFPEEHGGFGLSLQGVCSAIGALARHDRSVATTVGLHLGLGSRGLVAFGSDELKAAMIPDLATGQRIAAFATTEAGAGSDLGAIRTRGVPEGDRLKVDGEKVFVTNGALADVYTITTSTPGMGGFRKGHTLVMVERGDAGVTVGPEEDKLGTKGSSTTTVAFDGVDVPISRVIGEIGKGMTHLQHVLSWGRTVMSAGCAGTSARALAMTVEQVVNRQQFGQPIGRFDVVREQVADMAALVFAMEAIVRYTGAVEQDYDKLAQRSTGTKVFCSEESWRVLDMAIQLHGGSGYIEETGLALMLRDNRVTRIYEGANDVLTAHLGLMEAMSAPADEPLAVSPARAALGARADAFRGKVAAWRNALKKQWGIKLMRQQRHLHQLGQLAKLRDAAEAAVLRADQDGSEHAALLADHFLSIAEARALPLLGEVRNGDVIAALTSHLYGGRA